MRTPGGYVYEIDGRLSDGEYVPPDAIVGAWQVNDNGIIVGDFIPNPNYRNYRFGDEGGESK